MSNPNNHLEVIDGQISGLLSGSGDANWTYVIGGIGFQNGWTGDTSAATGYPVRFRKDSAGRVYVEGRATGGTDGAIAFTLPAGYRPDRHVPAVQGTAAPTISVETAGSVNINLNNYGAAVINLSFFVA